MVAMLLIVLGLFLARPPKPSPPGAQPEISQGEVPDKEAAVAEVAPEPDNSVKRMVASPGPAVVGPLGSVSAIAPESPMSIPDRWGIEITKVGLAAGGKALDLRYKVIDVAKATSLLYLTNFVYIYNQSNRTALIVPFQRENQTSQKLRAGKTYFTLLPNKEERVHSGSTVTVVLGGSRVENLVVN
jgi:hypothetical protein